jgi:hypothetical protein
VNGPRRVLGVVLVAAGTVVAVGLAVVGGLLLLVGSDDEEAPPGDSPSRSAAADACNGHAELCRRAYDEVSYAATHNSMSAASEPGWFFADQPDGILAQLDHGVRVLLIDSWYGRSTDRRGVVATAGSARAEAIKQANLEHGALAVKAALRVRRALGLEASGPTRPYLCHAMCELGSTSWGSSLSELRDWLDAHPREVVTVFVQDEVSPDDTAALVEEAGLLPYLHTPDDGGWPTLGEMVDSGHRLVLLMENHGGGAAHPWLLQGFDFVQDTPYLFKSAADFSCAPNRGDPGASLFLVNHWIDSKSNARARAEEVNAGEVLLRRLRECQVERGMLPNYVAVDHYDRGDLLDVVDELNGF